MGWVKFIMSGWKDLELKKEIDHKDSEWTRLTDKKPNMDKPLIFIDKNRTRVQGYSNGKKMFAWNGDYYPNKKILGWKYMFEQEEVKQKEKVNKAKWKKWPENRPQELFSKKFLLKMNGENGIYYVNAYAEYIGIGLVFFSLELNIPIHPELIRAWKFVDLYKGE